MSRPITAHILSSLHYLCGCFGNAIGGPLAAFVGFVLLLDKLFVCEAEARMHESPGKTKDRRLGGQQEGKQMNAIRLVALLAIMGACGTVSSAEPYGTVSRQAGSSSFSVQVPEGWSAREGNASEQGGTRLLELITVGADGQAGTPKLSAVIKFVFYPDKVPLAAQRYWEGLTYDDNVELPRIEGLASWGMFGRHGRRDGKIATAYYQLRSGVLVVDLSDLPDERYEQAREVFLGVLRSFQEARAPTGRQRRIEGPGGGLRIQEGRGLARLFENPGSMEGS